MEGLQIEDLIDSQVPYELLNKQFRASQKIIDREISKFSSAAADLEKKIENSAHLTVSDVTCALSSMVDNLSVLKRKNLDYTANFDTMLNPNPS